MNRADGFSLLEALVATAVLLGGISMLAQLSVIAAQSNRRAEMMTIAATLAETKVAQLSALTWADDDVGRPISDSTSDTTRVPEAGDGGTGLTPGGDLDRDASGYSDYADPTGRVIAVTMVSSGPPGFVRRWRIDRLAEDPDRTLVIQVVVAALPHGDELVRVAILRTRRIR